MSRTFLNRLDFSFIRCYALNMEELKKVNIRLPAPVAVRMKNISMKSGRKLEWHYLEAALAYIEAQKVQKRANA
jgi:hypothetical protein